MAGVGGRYDVLSVRCAFHYSTTIGIFHHHATLQYGAVGGRSNHNNYGGNGVLAAIANNKA